MLNEDKAKSEERLTIEVEELRQQIARLKDECKQKEYALRLSEKQLLEFVENVDDVVYLISVEPGDCLSIYHGQ